MAPNADPSALSELLPGTWELVSRVDRDADGDPVPEPSLGSDPVALLFYDRAGHFAAQFMRRDRTGPVEVESSASPRALNNTRAVGGYDAYFGRYTVDDAEATVTQTLVGALSADNVGHTVTRRMLVSGDTLTITLQTTSTEGRPVERTLLWKRVG